MKYKYGMAVYTDCGFGYQSGPNLVTLQDGTVHEFKTAKYPKAEIDLYEFEGGFIFRRKDEWSMLYDFRVLVEPPMGVELVAPVTRPKETRCAAFTRGASLLVGGNWCVGVSHRMGIATYRMGKMILSTSLWFVVRPGQLAIVDDIAMYVEDVDKFTKSIKVGIV